MAASSCTRPPRSTTATKGADSTVFPPGRTWGSEDSMARPMWKGAITFGLVSIPIEVHTAVRDKQLRFHLLTSKDHARVKYERVSEKTHKPVAWNDLVKGYEYSKGRFVVLTPEDFEAAALEKTRTIDILDFVQADDVDDRFFDKPYYVTPGAGGDRAYVLLRETIREAEKIGI